MPIEQSVREHQLGGRVPRLDLDCTVGSSERTLARIVELRSRIVAEPIFLCVDVGENGPCVRIVGVELDCALQAGTDPGVLPGVERP